MHETQQSTLKCSSWCKCRVLKRSRDFESFAREGRLRGTWSFFWAASTTTWPHFCLVPLGPQRQHLSKAFPLPTPTPSNLLLMYFIGRSVFDLPSCVFFLSFPWSTITVILDSSPRYRKWQPTRTAWPNLPETEGWGIAGGLRSSTPLSGSRLC